MSQAYVSGITSSNIPPDIATSYVENSGTAVPADNVLNVLGDTTTINTTGSGNTITINAIAQNGSLILIATKTASSSASLAFTSIGNYNNYLLQWDNVVLTVSSTINLSVSTNSGSSYLSSGYESGYQQFTYNSASVSNGNSTSEFLFGPGIGTSAGDSGAGHVNLYDITSGAALKLYGNSIALDGGTAYFSIFGGMQTATGINALQVSVTSGSMTTGNFNLYGIIQE